VPTDQRLSDHLQRMLAARHPERTFEVVNLGRAGVNSAYVANRLESDIAGYRPQLVIVWVGVNDLWNPLETEAWPTPIGTRHAGRAGQRLPGRAGSCGFSGSSAAPSGPARSGRLRSWRGCPFGAELAAAVGVRSQSPVHFGWRRGHRQRISGPMRVANDAAGQGN
jgi:hypothetical protein